MPEFPVSGDPDVVRRLHALEQLGGVAASIASVAAAFYRQLERDGVPPDAAARITGHFVDTLLAAFARP